MTMSSENPTVELALSELRRSVDVGLTEVRGQLALLLQRSDQGDRRADQHEKTIDVLEERLTRMERDTVTHADLDKKSSRTITVLSLIMTGVSIVTAAATAIVIAIVN